MTESTNAGRESGGRSQGSNAGSAANEVRRAFAGLPFDQKISTLIQVELDMLGDAVNSVVTAVSKAVDDERLGVGGVEPFRDQRHVEPPGQRPLGRRRSGFDQLIIWRVSLKEFYE